MSSPASSLSQYPRPIPPAQPSLSVQAMTEALQNKPVIVNLQDVLDRLTSSVADIAACLPVKAIPQSTPSSVRSFSRPSLGQGLGVGPADGSGARPTGFGCALCTSCRRYRS